MKKIIKTFFTCLVISSCIYFLTFMWLQREDELDSFQEKSEILNSRIDTLQKKIQKEILIRKIVACESGGDDEKWGDLNYSYPAYGRCQFQHRTFRWLSEKANFIGDWKNSNDQIYLMGWALDNGYGNLWTCYRKFKEEGSI